MFYISILNFSSGSGDLSMPEQIDLKLELPRCLLLQSQGKHNEFITGCKNILFNPFLDMFTPRHRAVILSNKSQKHRITAFKQMMGPSIENKLKAATGMLTDSSYTLDDLWDLYLRLCDVLIEEGRLEDFLELAIMAILNPLFQSDANKVAVSSLTMFIKV